MPRNVRNFWIKLIVDGRETKIAAGPLRKDGGFDLTILQRSANDILEAMNIIGRERNGVLTLTARPISHDELTATREGSDITTVITTR